MIFKVKFHAAEGSSPFKLYLSFKLVGLSRETWIDAAEIYSGSNTGYATPSHPF